jgi:alpha-amylase/alpha-mannosidase (GH57 family)
MNLWHLTPDASRTPVRVSSDNAVTLNVGTWPIESGQAVWVEYEVRHLDGTTYTGFVSANWNYNAGSNSFWQAKLGPFSQGDYVTYIIRGRSLAGDVTGPQASFKIAPKLYLAIMWHQHQPIYKDTGLSSQIGSYRYPWVRLHAIRDYYSMAALVAQHHALHITINLTPSLLWQLEDYLKKGATDRVLDLTLKPSENLTSTEREEILSTFFDADWHNQIFPHPRYKELFVKRRGGESFKTEDVRDLQMWFSLAWFGKEFRDGKVDLTTGETVSVQRYVKKGHDFSAKDIESMVDEQYKIMRAIIPIHRQLQERGQIEVSTTPFYHPILPLLIDTDDATIDRPGAKHPRRFSFPEDAEAQVQLAVDYYIKYFGQPPYGMWPAEGAVSQSVVPVFSKYNVRWIASDKGVLAKSGQWGYEVENPNIICQPYRAEENNDAVTIFFRDTELSDKIGFYYYGYADPEQAARDFITNIKNHFVRHVSGEEDRVLSVILDGENAWGSYRDDARPFLHSLYGLLEDDNEIQTVTFSEYLAGNPSNDVHPHPIASQKKVHNLFTGSWIDESASRPGVDLGTWIGEEEENRGWELLRQARNFLNDEGVTYEKNPAAFEALYASEGSDWFWWFGKDQDSGNDEEFDDLFRTHLKNIYRELGADPPAELDLHIVPHTVVWTFTHQVKEIQSSDRLTIRTNCPGLLSWQLTAREFHTDEMLPSGGVMAGVQRYNLVLGPFPEGARELRFRFQCTYRNCKGKDICCEMEKYKVSIT